MADLRRTPLYDAHVEAGAKLVDFAGWEMPVQYDGIGAEHLAVRSSCGVFDVSHMGEVETEGPGAGELLQRLLTNDISKLEVGGAIYSCVCREDGGVLDDVFTYRLADQHYLTVTNASNHDKIMGWFADHAEDYDAVVNDRLADYAMLAVQGPKARADRRLDGPGRPARPPPRRRHERGTRRRPGLRHGLHRRGRRRAPGAARLGGGAVGGARGRGRQARRPRRPRHPAPGGQLLPLRQRAERGADPDRGGARLGAGGWDRLRRAGALLPADARWERTRCWPRSS